MRFQPGIEIPSEGFLRRRAGPDRLPWMIRPQDLVVLHIEPIRLRIEPGEGDRHARLVRDGLGTAYLLVTFPPQHLTETSYFTTVDDYPILPPLAEPDGKVPPRPIDPDLDEDGKTQSDPEPPDDPPIQAIIAGWSRLAFIVRDDQLPIDWTIDGVLEALKGLELSVASNALPPQPARPRIRPGLVGMPVDHVSLAAMTAANVGPAIGLIESVAASPAVTRAGAVLRGAHERRILRTSPHALGLTDQTGSSTVLAIGHESVTTVGQASGLAIHAIHPEPQPPAPTQTRLELPYRLILSPNKHGSWFHSGQAVTSEETGQTELWHTRLGTRHPDGTRVEGADPMRTVRAIWTLDEEPPVTPTPGTSVQVPKPSNAPFRMSLDGFDRHNVVHLSSNFALREWDDKHRFYEPGPIDVNNLALSSLGGWLDSRGVWDDSPLGLSVEEWRHRATMGRDHFVRVVYAGRVFPTGHRSSVIKITERRFHEDKPGHTAYLRTLMFLVVREPLRRYRVSGTRRYDLATPYEAMRITNLVSPLLDPPGDTDIDGQQQICFWPYVGDRPYLFHVVGTDTTGRPSDIAMPMIFVGQGVTDLDHDETGSIVPTQVRDHYQQDTWPNSSTLLSTISLGGQKVALAEGLNPDDTTFAVQSLTLGAEVPATPDYNKMNKREPRFFPVVRSARIDLPTLQAVAQTTESAGVVYADDYLVEGFDPENAGQVFLAKDPAATDFGVQFSKQSERSGGLVAPDLMLSGVSRITGPVSGDLGTVHDGSFSPGAWFGAIADAKLFGVLRLKDIVDVAPLGELDKVPRFTGGSFDQVERLIADLERIERLLAADPQPAAAATLASLDQLLDPDAGSLADLLASAVPGPVAPGPVVTDLTSLHGDLGDLLDDLPGSSLGPGPRAVVAESAASLQATIAAVLAKPSLLTAFAEGDELPRALTARFEWRPVLKTVPPIFYPTSERNLLLAVEAAGEHFTVTCSLDDFMLDLAVLRLRFERVQFRVRDGAKPEIEVRFQDPSGFEFIGPLSFVEVLRSLIPFDGFADPPSVSVTAQGIEAGFSMGLPNIAVGVFSLENLAIGGGFSVPFIGEPVSTWFRFCERENPSRLTVSMFGGGFFFGVTVNVDGIQIAEGAFEFGAAISVDFGVASGSVSAMAGIYFKIEPDGVTLAGYFRLRGEVEALGIVSVCIELYLEIRYESASGKCVGTATISIEIDVTLFSATISISCTKKFAGSGKDPTLAELLDVAADATSADWNAYCAAFA
jgi:hypothetical protein